MRDGRERVRAVAAVLLRLAMLLAVAMVAMSFAFSYAQHGSDNATVWLMLSGWGIVWFAICYWLFKRG